MAKTKGLKQIVLSKRHAKVASKSVDFTKPDIRRLCWRAGVKRISRNVYEECRAIARAYAEGVIRDAILYMDHQKLKTVQVSHVVYAGQRRGTALYGYSSCGAPPRKRLMNAPANEDDEVKNKEEEQSGEEESDEVENKEEEEQSGEDENEEEESDEIENKEEDENHMDIDANGAIRIASMIAM